MSKKNKQKQCINPCPLCGGCACNIAVWFRDNPLEEGECWPAVCASCLEPMMVKRVGGGYAIVQKLEEEDIVNLPGVALQHLATITSGYEEIRRRRANR